MWLACILPMWRFPSVVSLLISEHKTPWWESYWSGCGFQFYPSFNLWATIQRCQLNLHDISLCEGGQTLIASNTYTTCLIIGLVAVLPFRDKAFSQCDWTKFQLKWATSRPFYSCRISGMDWQIIDMTVILGISDVRMETLYRCPHLLSHCCSIEKTPLKIVYYLF